MRRDKDSLVRCRAGNACSDDTVAYLVELLAGSLEQSLGRRFTVDGVDHHLLRSDVLDGLQPGSHIGLAGVVDRLACRYAAHKHGLDDDMSLEGLQTVDDEIHVVGAVGMVHLHDVVRVDGVELQDVVVHSHEGVVHLLAVDHGGIAQHGDLRLGTVVVAQADGVVDDLSEVGMTGGLAVAGKGQHVGQLAIGRHLQQLLLQRLGHLAARGQGQGGAVVFVESAFAVDAVERAQLPISRQQVDAQRDAQSATVYGAENG